MKHIVAVITALLFLGLVFLICENMDKPVKKHPRVIEIESYEIDAILRSYSNVVAIRGTGSMRPLIPAGKPDEIVAWAILDNSKDFALLEQGLVVVFDSGKNGLIIHELNQLDKDGWISSGSYNGFYDAGRVTRTNLRGVVISIYKLKK